MIAALLLAGCVHTPPHAAVPGAWRRTVARREQMRVDGRWCAWESEALSWDERTLWSVAPPEDDNWCAVPGESARWFDVVGQDGPFLSTRLQDDGCCPAAATVRCVTWNVETGAAATLDDYDARLAERRWARAQVELARDPALRAYTLDRNAFVVTPGGHVSFCAAPPGGAHSRAALRAVDVR